MVTMGIIESRKNEIGICNNIDNNSNTPLLYVEWLSVRGRHFLRMCTYVCFHRVSIVSEVYCRLILFKTWIRSRNSPFYRNLRVLKDLSETERNFQLVSKNRRKGRSSKSGSKSYLYYMGTTLKCKYEFFVCIET